VLVHCGPFGEEMDIHKCRATRFGSYGFAGSATFRGTKTWVGR